MPPQLCIAYFVSKSKQTFPARTLHSEQEITDAEALLLSVAVPAYYMKYATNEAVYYSIGWTYEHWNYSYQCLPFG